MTSPTSKRQVFAKEYILDHNATQAAIRAGYSERSAKQQGSRLLTYVDVKDEIAVLERAQREVDEIDRAYVVAGLRELAETAESESTRVRSLELLGKTMRMFVEKVETTHTLEVPELAEFSLDDLLAMRESMRPAIEGEVRVLGG
jgi:phage terminase small subunit